MYGTAGTNGTRNGTVGTRFGTLGTRNGTLRHRSARQAAGPSDWGAKVALVWPIPRTSAGHGTFFGMRG